MGHWMDHAARWNVRNLSIVSRLKSILFFFGLKYGSPEMPRNY